jgi:hypothetical protein
MNSINASIVKLPLVLCVWGFGGDEGISCSISVIVLVLDPTRRWQNNLLESKQQVEFKV